MARPPRVTDRRPHDLIREGRTVLYRDEPARVVTVHWTTPHPLNAPHPIGARLHLLRPGVELAWVPVEDITAHDPIEVSAAGVRAALTEHNPELLGLIARISSTRRVTHLWPDRSVMYAAGLANTTGACRRLADALAWCWSDATGLPGASANTGRVVIAGQEPDCTVMIWRARWAETTPVPSRRVTS